MMKTCVNLSLVAFIIGNTSFARAADPATMRIGYIGLAKPPITLSLVEMPPADLGVAGARLAIDDNNTTGQFTKQAFELVERTVGTPEEAVAAAGELVGEGIGILVSALPADQLLAIADSEAGRSALIFNAGAKDNELRAGSCRVNVVHTAPSHAMLADGLAQYLVWKRWDSWLLLSGALPADKLWADALKGAARKFGATIVEERVYSETDTARRTDSGHVQIQRQLPVFTQNAPEHDVVVVADESEIFGTHVPFRTWDPRPVAGSAGLMPVSWSASMEQWGGLQLQSRFEKRAARGMRALDMDAWTAVRIIGEAATRAKSVEAGAVRDYVLGPDLSIAAFKGQKLTIRPWDHQLRQPVLLTDARSVISVSPQEGFLHQRTELDTLGVDEPETACRFG